MGQGTGDRLQVTEDRLQRTEDKSPMALSTISVGILKFFKTILRPWQAVVLKNFRPTLYSFSKKNLQTSLKKLINEPIGGDPGHRLGQRTEDK